MHNILYIAGLVLPILLQSTLGPPGKAQNAPHPSVSLGKQISLKIKGITPYADFEVVSAKNGTFWAFTLTHDKEYAIAGAYFDGFNWTPIKKITPSYKSLHVWTAISESSGNPLIFWKARLDSAGQPHSEDDIEFPPCILLTRYSNGKWSKPETIVKHRGSFSINYLSASRDPNENVHIIYDGQMSPSEEYSIGLLIVDGQFPNKLFHIVYDGNKWHPPSPTMSRGSFHVQDPRLTVSAAGRVFLSVTIHPFNRLTGLTNSYLAFQHWDGKKWTDIERLTPLNMDVDRGQMVIDAKGLKHLWWSQNVVTKKYGRIQNNNLTAAQTLEKEGTDPSMGSDSKGRVYLCWSYGKTKLILWNGKDWSSPITLPVSNRSEAPPKFVSTTDGRIFIAYAENDKLIIREIIMGPSH